MGNAKTKELAKYDKYYTFHTDELSQVAFGYVAQFQRKYRGRNGSKWPSDMLKSPIIYIIIAYFPRRFGIYGIGYNNFGEFGLGHTDVVSTFERLLEWERLLDHSSNIYRGYGRFMLKTIYGELYCSGNNYRGDVGTDDSHSRNIDTFRQIAQHSADTQFLCNIIGEGTISNHALLISNYPHSNLYGFGSNRRGQLGNYYADEYMETNWSPIQILADEPNLFHSETIIKIKCGEYHTLFLSKEGNVYSCGDNLYGQCGVSKTHSIEFKNGSVEASKKARKHKKKYLPITRIAELSDMTDIACGAYHNLCINRKKELFVFGDNPNGQLAMPLIMDNSSQFQHQFQSHDIGNDIDSQNIVYTPRKCPYFAHKRIKIQSIECGNTFSCVLDLDGNCFLFGENKYGQIGTGKEFVLAISKPHCINKLAMINGIKINQISVGYQHSVLLSHTNEIYAFGDNQHHQCSSHNVAKKISLPYPLSREEIGLEAKQRIERIIAGSDTTIIITRI